MLNTYLGIIKLNDRLLRGAGYQKESVPQTKTVRVEQ